jgi:putative glutamine amidotransferase
LNAVITQREQIDKHNVKVDVLESNYILYFESLGLELDVISNFASQKNILNKLKTADLIILTGGGSVNSDNMNVLNSFEDIQTKRDIVERELLMQSKILNIPVLAICRGFQFINIHLGGSVKKLKFKETRTIGKEHLVFFSNGSKAWVNNFHNDGIYLTDLAEGLKIVAIDEPNLQVESFYHPEFKWLGILWHPERKISDQKSREQVDSMILKFIQQRGVIDESYYFSSWTRY